MEAATTGSAAPGGDTQKLLHAATVELKSAPFRAERIALAYLPVVPKALDYGAKGYSFYRSDDDPERFVHISFWDNKDDFEQYWFSHEMQKVRQQINGIHDLPLQPHWHTVLEHRASG